MTRSDGRGKRGEIAQETEVDLGPDWKKSGDFSNLIKSNYIAKYKSVG